MILHNVAIIAHVDHGKTTLVDKMLQQSGSFRENQRVAERVMDSNDLEKERGITILAKATSVVWRGTRVNIVDTPGHADFGGEVERILSMVDGVIVLVDAAEGPMPQTKFVVSKALKIGLRPIVAINKVDRPDARSSEVINEVFDLFAALDATDEQLDFPILYGSGRDGWLAATPEGPKDEGLAPLFDLILKHVPEAKTEPGPFRMLGTLLEANQFLGRIITGRIISGTVKPNQTVKVLSRDGQLVENGRVSKILAFRGIERAPIEIGEAGDIVSIAGLVKASVADTFCDPAVTEPIQAQPIDPPTVSMSFLVNDSPLAGTEGDKVTSRVIRDRLLKEAEGNVALKVEESKDKDSFIVSGRGELQLAILIETMRREGFEIGVSRPRVVLQKDEDRRSRRADRRGRDRRRRGAFRHRRAEDVGAQSRHAGDAAVRRQPPAARVPRPDPRPDRLSGRTADRHQGHGDHEPPVPFLRPLQGRDRRPQQRRADLERAGEAVAYALWNLEDRGPMIIEPGWKVYQGMLIGVHTRDNDLEVNVLKGKKLTNIRTQSKDEAVRLTPPIRMTLERSLAWIQDDELVEVTPKSIRLRKRLLDPNDRKRESRKAEAEVA